MLLKIKYLLLKVQINNRTQANKIAKLLQLQILIKLRTLNQMLEKLI